MQITREFTFDAAHQLHGYDGRCARLHGHTYRLEVTIEGPVKEDGMVMDFKGLKSAVKEAIRPLDHSFLNDTIDIPTAENTVLWIWNRLKDKLPLKMLRLWETPTCSASLTHDSPEHII